MAPMGAQAMAQQQLKRYEELTFLKLMLDLTRVWLQDFKVDTFEYHLLREVEFRQSITRRVAGEADAEINVQPSAGPVAPPQIAQKARNSKLLEGSDATFSAKITANPSPRVSDTTIIIDCLKFFEPFHFFNFKENQCSKTSKPWIFQICKFMNFLSPKHLDDCMKY